MSADVSFPGLRITRDRYSGLVCTLEEGFAGDVEAWGAALATQLGVWRSEGVRGIWSVSVWRFPLPLFVPCHLLCFVLWRALCKARPRRVCGKRQWWGVPATILCASPASLVCLCTPVSCMCVFVCVSLWCVRVKVPQASSDYLKPLIKVRYVP